MPPSSASARGTDFRLTPARHRALEIIDRHDVVLYRGFRGPFRVMATGTSARITMPVIDALSAAGLIARDVSVSIHSGQPLLLTPAGRATLHAAGTAPGADARAAPAPASRQGPTR
ncbi:hypothetical protein ACFRI7_11885 [Streptomyces sp. NPDC056716]|uniref:hypothetical protein n=1 Tax=unclassified Streptomyces TaxID=2593676 RepID=UPI0036884554